MASAHVEEVGGCPTITRNGEESEVYRKPSRPQESAVMPAAEPSPHCLKSCQMSAEIQAVLAVMRQSGSRWSQNVPIPIDEAFPEDPLVHSLKTLRKDVLTWTADQWESLPPITYLTPFLHVIATDKTNTVVTGVAVSSLQKILALNFFTSQSYGAGEAMHQIVSALTSCHFEIVDGASEESVLLRILQVLLVCVRCDASSLLTDREVCLMVNTCFRVLNRASELSGTGGDVLQRAACQTLTEMIREIFSKLPSLPAGEDEVSAADSAEGTLTPLASTGDEVDSKGEYAATKTDHAGSSEAASATDLPSSGQDENGRFEQDLHRNRQKSRSGGVSAQPPGGYGEADNEAGNKNNHTSLAGSGRPHGISCRVEILLFLCRLLDPDYIAAQQLNRQTMSFLSFNEKDEEETPLLPLSLVAAGLELAGNSIARHQKLLVLIQDDLFRALLYHGLSPSLLVFSQVLSLIYLLHQTLRNHLKLQLEAFFSCVLLRLALGPKHGGSVQQQELALEAICDFCTQPSFATELYANYDCEITCTNTFEEMATMLSRAAIPVNSPLTTINVLALDAILNILSSLSRRVQPGLVLPPAQLPSDLDALGESFWTSVPEDVSIPEAWVDHVQKKKFIKRRLLIGADHFNRDPKKGVQFLQGIGLFPNPLDARSVASFFRYTPGLSKLFMGDYLGDHDDFKVKVLLEFVKLFDFHNLALDAALRTFLESFRLPGEAQKIARVLEAFAEHYYEQFPGVLANKDTAYILAYSLIMLNTDQHNGQVKKKMTEEEFIRNNRKINDGQDLPRDMLSDLYHSIAKNEIRITADASSRAYHEMTYSLWMDLLRRSSTCTPYLVCNSCPVLDRELFALIASPSIAAISVVFDSPEADEVLLRKCADGFSCLAHLCASFGLGDLLNDLVISICKFISLLNPGAVPGEPAVTFGEDLRARLAAITVFGIANRHGDMIRAAWRNILECVLRLHKLGLLPGKVLAEVEDMPVLSGEGDSMHKSPSGLPVSTLAMTSPHIIGRKKQSGGLISRVSQYFLMDTEETKTGPTESQAAAQQNAVSTIALCKVGDVFSGSHVLQPASLQQLANSLVWAAGKPLRGGGSTSPEDEDTAMFCLDLLLVVTIANSSRVALLWPLVSDCISSIVQSASGPNPLVERAVIGTLRVCQKVVPRVSESTAEELLRSLQLILALDARAAETYCNKITREVKILVYSGGVTSIRSVQVWKSICRLLAMSSRHEEAWEPGFEGLTFVMSEGGKHVTRLNYAPCMDAARDFAESRAGGMETSKKALDLIGGLVTCLERWREATETAAQPAGESRDQVEQEKDKDRAPLTQSQLADMWLRLAQVLRRVCLDPREEVRAYAVFWLQRCLLAGEALGMPVTVWTPTFDQVIFALLTDLVEASARPKEYRGIESTLQGAVKMLSKVFLHFLPVLSTLPGPGFRALWMGVLGHVEKALKVGKRLPGGEQLQESILEVMKNMLMVMQSKAILVNTPDDAESLWQETWKAVRGMLPKLKPEVVDQLIRQQAPATLAPGPS